MLVTKQVEILVDRLKVVDPTIDAGTLPDLNTPVVWMFDDNIKVAFSSWNDLFNALLLIARLNNVRFRDLL